MVNTLDNPQRTTVPVTVLTGYLGAGKTTLLVRIQVEERGMREGIANSQEWAEIASRKKAIAERA